MGGHEFTRHGLRVLWNLHRPRVSGFQAQGGDRGRKGSLRTSQHAEPGLVDFPCLDWSGPELNIEVQNVSYYAMRVFHLCPLRVSCCFLVKAIDWACKANCVPSERELLNLMSGVACVAICCNMLQYVVIDLRGLHLSALYGLSNGPRGRSNLEARMRQTKALGKAIENVRGCPLCSTLVALQKKYFHFGQKKFRRTLSSER